MTPTPISAFIDRLSFKSGIAKLTVETAELTEEEKLYLVQNETKQGYFYFQQAPIQEIFIPAVQLGEFETKTPSQRMHNVIYRLWEKSDKSKDSEAYYKSTMEKIIDQLKEKLN